MTMRTTRETGETFVMSALLVGLRGVNPKPRVQPKKRPRTGEWLY